MRNSVLYGVIIIGAFLSLVAINAIFPSFAEAVVTTFQFKTISCDGCTLTNGTQVMTIHTKQGTYNQTLANNVVKNSGGNRINILNSSVPITHVVNDPTRNQVNITFNGATFTTRTIDLSTAGVYTTTIDNDTADTAITATAEPAAPQFVQIISGANIPTDTTDVQDYTIVITVGGKNTNATTAKTISVIPTRNGVDGGEPVRSIGVTNGNFWTAGAYMSGSALVAGDKIGLKMWCSSSPCSSGGGLDYRYATLYIVPRQFVSNTNSIYTIMPSGFVSSLTLTGAVAGVTYSLSTPNIGINPVGSVTDVIIGSSAVINNMLQTTAFKGQNLSELGTTTSPLANRAGTDTGFTPTQQAASNLLKISFAQFVRINTIS